MSESRVWYETEGSAWYSRNRDRLGQGRDYPLELLERFDVRVTCILDVGCSNGWRLERLRQRYNCWCAGVDVSGEAINEGLRAYPGLVLSRRYAHDLPWSDGLFECVIMSFVLHWVDRSKLLATFAEIDRVLKPGGYLVLSDFLPDEPTKRAYRHQAGLWTWKLNYPALLEDTGCYDSVASIVYNHDTDEEGDAPAGERAVCSLLRKGDYYANNP